VRGQQRAEPQADERQSLLAGQRQRPLGRGVERRQGVGDGGGAGGGRRVAGVRPLEAKRAQACVRQRDREGPLFIVGGQVLLAPGAREHHRERQGRRRNGGRRMPPCDAGMPGGLDQHGLRRRSLRGMRRGDPLLRSAISPRRGEHDPSARRHDATCQRSGRGVGTAVKAGTASEAGMVTKGISRF
jgi:hypothetical protein